MTRPYLGESADEWLGISCPEDCEPEEVDYDDYATALEAQWHQEEVLND